MSKNWLSVENFKILNGSWLKVLAIVSMFIDHFAYLILPHFEFANQTFQFIGESFSLISLCRLVGRLAFPIFAFLITEGFVHTKNRKKYGLNLLIFAVISEIPYNLLMTGDFLYFGSQNVYFTLFLGFVSLYILEYIDDETRKALLLFVVVLFALLIKSDYGAKGVLLILVLYYFRDQRMFAGVLAFGLLSGGIGAWCAFVPINMYNGERGFIKGKNLKYFFYAFYPAHILFLVAIKKMLIQ